MLEFKAAVLHPTEKGLEVDTSQLIQLDFNIDENCITIPAKTYDKRKKKSFNRAKEKRKFQQLVDDTLYGNNEDDLEL